MNKTGDLYLEGYWQSEKYFKNYRKIILKDFSLKKPLGQMAENILNEVKATQFHSVSLHIRRGDNAYNLDSMKSFGMPSPDYYLKAMEIMAKKDNNIKFFIFSDEIDWVKKNMRFNFPTTFVSQPEIKDEEEIYLMSKCKHHIISNSTFSWWGAWLNQSAEKKVIAPSHWATLNKEKFKDIIPEDWVRI